MTKSKTKKVDIYDIGDDMELLNICVKNAEGRLDHIATFIGRHGSTEFISVGHTEGLADPGAIFSYASFVKMQKMHIELYKQIYADNMKSRQTVFYPGIVRGADYYQDEKDIGASLFDGA